MSRNVRVYLPFWIAIPAWLLAACVWAVIAIAWGLTWLIAQAGIATARAGRKRAVHRAAPRVLGAPDVATAMWAAGIWTGSVRKVTFEPARLVFEIYDPSRRQAADFIIPAHSMPPELASLRPGDVVRVAMNPAGRDVQVDVLEKAP